MNKKVTMFVWNDFYNDSRVLRECTALTQAGYQINLIALGKTNKIEKRTSLFNIYRVAFKNIEKIKDLFFFASIAILSWNYIISTMFVVVFLMLNYTKLIFLIRKIVLTIKMIILGLSLKTDIYHANDLNTLIQATICAKLKGKKLIFDSHEVNTSRSGYDSWIYSFLEKSLIHIPDCVIHENHTRAK